MQNKESKHLISQYNKTIKSPLQAFAFAEDRRFKLHVAYFLKAIESIHLWLNLQNTALKDSTSEEDIYTRTEPTKGFVSER